MSLKIDEYLSYCGEVSELLKIRQHRHQESANVKIKLLAIYHMIW